MSILVLPRPAFLRQRCGSGWSLRGRQRPLVRREDRDRRRGGDRSGAARAAEAYDLLPNALEVVAEDDQQVPRLGAIQGALDGFLLVVDLGREAVRRKAGGEKSLAHDLTRLTPPAASAIVVLAHDDEIEGGSGGSGELQNVLVATVAGGGNDADAPAVHRQPADGGGHGGHAVSVVGIVQQHPEGVLVIKVHAAR